MSFKSATVCSILCLGTACSSAPKDVVHQQDLDAVRAQVGEIRNQMTSLGAHLDSLETKLTAMNDKVESTRVAVDNFMNVQTPRTTTAMARPSDDSGIDVSQPQAKSDPESGFETDDAVESFRKAMILFEARKFPDAILAFSGFVEKYPDHALGGSAQYYVGESYFREKEYKLALQEFERVLTTYDRSAHVADTLARMAEVEDHLKLTDAAARHRHLLTSLFAESPAAADLRDAPRETAGTPASAPPVQNVAAPASGATATDGSHLDEPPPTAPVAPATGAMPDRGKTTQ